MINLRGNIWIEGFDSQEEMLTFIQKWNSNDGENVDPFFDDICIYQGMTIKIPEDIAEECAYSGILTLLYKDYTLNINIFETAIESIQSACKKEFCIIITM